MFKKIIYLHGSHIVMILQETIGNKAKNVMGAQVNTWQWDLRGVRYKSCIEIETQVRTEGGLRIRSERKGDHLLEFLEKKKKLVKVLTK